MFYGCPLLTLLFVRQVESERGDPAAAVPHLPRRRRRHQRGGEAAHPGGGEAAARAAQGK